MDNRIQYYIRVWSEKHRRYAQFWFNARRPDMHIWNINMNADYVPSQQLSTSERDPHDVMLEMLAEWKTALV